jgi:hypothetical protein
VIRPHAGQLIFFDGSKNPHYARPLSSGSDTRVVAVMNFYTKSRPERKRPPELNRHLFGEDLGAPAKIPRPEPVSSYIRRLRRRVPTGVSLGCPGMRLQDNPTPSATILLRSGCLAANRQYRYEHRRACHRHPARAACAGAKLVLVVFPSYVLRLQLTVSG